MNSLLCKTMYWSEGAPLNGYIIIFKTIIKTSIVSLTCCDLHIFAIWIIFAIFAGQTFMSQSEKERPRPLHGIFFYMACFLLESSDYAYWFFHSSSVCHFWFLLVLNPELDFSCAPAVSAAFFSEIQVSFRYLFNFMALFNTNSVWKFSFTVTAVKDCSNQILNCQGGSDFDDTHNTCIPIFERLSSAQKSANYVITWWTRWCVKQCTDQKKPYWMDIYSNSRREWKHLLSRWLTATCTILQNEWAFAVFAGQTFMSQSEKERPRPL